MTGVPLQDAILDDTAVAQLMFDIEHAGELIGIVIRPMGARRAQPTESTLAAASAALVARTASVQLRYTYAGEEWWDTLLPTPAGTRLVRISHTRALATPGPE